MKWLIFNLMWMCAVEATMVVWFVDFSKEREHVHARFLDS